MSSKYAQALVTGIWCATVGVSGREQMLSVEHPTWVDSWSDPRAMRQTVQVGWFGEHMDSLDSRQALTNQQTLN